MQSTNNHKWPGYWTFFLQTKHYKNWIEFTWIQLSHALNARVRYVKAASLQLYPKHRLLQMSNSFITTTVYIPLEQYVSEMHFLFCTLLWIFQTTNKPTTVCEKLIHWAPHSEWLLQLTRQMAELATRVQFTHQWLLAFSCSLFKQAEFSKVVHTFPLK